MDQETKNYIDQEILKVQEKILLTLPEVWSALLVDMKGGMELNEKFYKGHPEFKGHEDAVKSIVDKIDGMNPMMSLKDKLDTAVPEIRKRIEMTKGLTMDVHGVPDTSFQPIKSAVMGSNGKV